MRTNLSGKWKWAMICVAGMAFVGCDNNTQEAPAGSTKGYKLSKAESCAELESQIVDTLLELAIDGKYSQPRTDPSLNNANGSNNGTPDPGPTPQVDGGPPDEFTTTNAQEEGVDEPDFVKTDGDYIYSLQGNELIIMKTQPADETAVVGKLAISGSDSASMFLQDDRIAIFSTVNNEHCNEVPEVNSFPGQGPAPTETCSEDDAFSGTRVTLIDVTNRSAPTVLRSLDIESNFASARMIGSDVYVVSHDQDLIPQGYFAVVSSADSSLIEVDWQSTEDEVEAARQHARPILRAQLEAFVSSEGVQSFLPRTRSVSADGALGALGDLFACTDVYLPAQPTALGILNIAHIDLDDDTGGITSTGLLVGGSTVYASQENLYVALSSRNWWWGNGIAENSTHVHKFVLNAPDKQARYVASGKVDGWILNQFSLSEHNGHLRVATSDSRFVWNNQSSEGGNHLTIIEEENGELVETGAIRGFSKGKEMNSARLLGDKGFIATLEENDPLVTFDLSDPNDPKLEGQLSIDGLTGHMHPMGANHLLTIGHATDSGVPLGVHLQIFDVDDMKNPVQSHQLLMSTGPRSSSTKAIEDHRAFTYDPVNEILAIPFDSSVFVEGEISFSGMIVIQANAAGITELGRVSHGDILPNPVGADDDFQWQSDLRRSIFIDGFLYSISDLGVKVSELENPAVEVARVAFDSTL